MSKAAPEVEYSITVDPDKITRYLLDPNHAKGASKARFFLAFGFTVAETDRMQHALAMHLIDADTVTHLRDPLGYGDKLVAEGRIQSPDGRNPNIRTMWSWTSSETSGDLGMASAAFITAYPKRP